MSADVIVLDDVTPRYVKAGAALKACDVDLGIALFADRFRGSPARLALASRGSAPVVTPDRATTAAAGVLGAHRFAFLGRPAEPLLPLLALQKLDIHFRAVDANQFASAVSKAGRGQQQEELLEIEAWMDPSTVSSASLSETALSTQDRRHVPSIAMMQTS
jgi:hypothetical protein